jgi:AcrR family transcriptional regulator
MTETRNTAKEKVILAAAARRFAYYGFSKVTMDEIAADMDMAKASLYYYFPTKENLFLAVLGKERDQFLAEMRAFIDRTSSASEELKMYAAKRMELFRTLVNLSSLSTDKEKDLAAPFHEFLAGLEKEEMKILQQILQEGKRRGEFAIQGVQHTATLILHVLHGLRLRRIKSFRPAPFDDATYNNLTQEGRQVVELLLAGITKRK